MGVGLERFLHLLCPFRMDKLLVEDLSRSYLRRSTLYPVSGILGLTLTVIADIVSVGAQLRPARARSRTWLVWSSAAAFLVSLKLVSELVRRTSCRSSISAKNLASEFLSFSACLLWPIALPRPLHMASLTSPVHLSLGDCFSSLVCLRCVLTCRPD